MNAVRPEGDELRGSSVGAAIAAGMLVKATEAKRVPARKPRAMLAIASPRVLGIAIDTSVLDGIGYPAWRDERGADLTDVQPVKLAFSARRPEGGTETQSGMLYLPAPEPSGSRALTWVIFLKGTEHLRDNVPSRGGGSERTLMEAVAALGYAVWAPDYAGMGDGAGAQEYCVPESMAASALDGLAAARSYLSGRSADYSESGRLVVLGYSQGGLAAMATAAAASDGSIAIPGLTLAACYPLGAPLDLLLGVPFQKDGGVVIDRPDFSLLLVMGWSRAYPDEIKAGDILLPNVVDSVLPLFDGERDGDELCKLIAKAVGKKTGEVLATDIYSAEYLRALREAPETNPYYRAQNKARLDRWTPPSGLPIVLAATPKDELVPFENSALSFAWMRGSNPDADVSLIRLASDNHGRAAIEGLLFAIVDMDYRESEAPL